MSVDYPWVWDESRALPKVTSIYVMRKATEFRSFCPQTFPVGPLEADLSAR